MADIDMIINFLFVNNCFKSLKLTVFLLSLLLGTFTKNNTAKKAQSASKPVAKNGYLHECSPKKPPSRGPADIPIPIEPSKYPTAS